MPKPPQNSLKKAPTPHAWSNGPWAVHGPWRPLIRAPAVARWLWSVPALRKGAALARGASFGAFRGSLLMRPWPLELGGGRQKWNKLCAACVSADCAIEIWNFERACAVNNTQHADESRSKSRRIRPGKYCRTRKNNQRLDTTWVKPSWNAPHAAIADRSRPRCLREGVRHVPTVELEAAAACLGRSPTPAAFGRNQGPAPALRLASLRFARLRAVEMRRRHSCCLAVLFVLRRLLCCLLLLCSPCSALISTPHQGRSGTS